MATQLSNVNPGDLITSSLMNQIIATLNSQGLAIAALQTQPVTSTTTSESISVTYPPKQSPAGAVAANTVYTFQYALVVVSNQNDTYIVTPMLTTTDTGWTAVAVDGSGNALPQSQISFPAGNQTAQTINIQVFVPASATSAQLLVTLASVRTPKVIVGQSSAYQIIPGSSGSTDTTITASTPMVSVFSGTVAASLTSAGVAIVPVGDVVIIDFPISIAIAGTYSVSGPTLSNSTGWTATLIGSGMIQVTTVPAPAAISLRVTSATGAAPTMLSLSVSGNGAMLTLSLNAQVSTST